MSERLAGKIAIVSGGASGIGLATVKRFLDAGAKVVMADIDVERGEEEAAALKEAGKPVSFATLDVSSEEQWQDVIDDTVQTLGGFNVLVNSAGICEFRNVENETLEGFQKVIAVNLQGIFLGTKLAIAHMKHAGEGGAIVNVASVEGMKGDRMMPAYGATKGGVRIFSRSAAIHCAKSGYNIRVNCVCPGAIETPIFEKVGKSCTAEELEEVFNNAMSRIALGRPGQPIDIANACLYLASDEAAYVVGADLVVDGGFTA